MEPRRRGRTEQAAAIAAALMMAWYSIPEQERQWITIRALARLHRLAYRAALTTGYQAMSDELAGHGRARYPLAYALARARDRIARAIEDLRP